MSATLSGRSSALGRVIVTGASSGLGSAIARRLVKDGWSVINFDRIAPRQPTDGVQWVEVDLSDAAILEQTLAKVLEDGPVTGLVNNAGIIRTALLAHATNQDFDSSVAINMRAPMICARAIVPSMKAAGFGRIVNISSRAHLGKIERTAYSGTKGALISMARVWALELAKDGITSNVIAPGPIQTDLFDSGNPVGSSIRNRIVSSVPVGRLGSLEDIAHSVSFFMGPDAGFVTGQVLYVCGGTTLALAGS